MRRILYVMAFVVFALGVNAQITPTDGIVYVRYDGTGNGSSWGNATADLQGAIDADGVEEVRIGGGIYFPTWNFDSEDIRAYSFRLKNGVKIIGSFPEEGGEEGDINMVAHPSVFSGDIGITDDYSDNSYHVVYCNQDQMLDSTAELMYVVIGKGNADIDDSDKKRGGGIFIEGCNPSFYGCEVSDNRALRGAGIYSRESHARLFQCDVYVNHATETGGGILSSVDDGIFLNFCNVSTNSSVDGAGIANTDNSAAIYENCCIDNNIASNYGGGMLNFSDAAPVIKSCKIYSNRASNGGGVLNSSAYPVFYNCYIDNNEAITAGGGVLNNNGGMARYFNCDILSNTATVAGGVANSNSTSYITNSIIYGNGSQITNVSGGMSVVSYSCVEGGFSGTAIMDENPMLDNGLMLKANSPLINAGLNDSVPEDLIYDLFGNVRIIDGIVDVGACEFTGIIYVDFDAPGENCGTCWENAFTSLESAMDVASPGNEIWVAAGTYMPSDENGTGTGADYYTFKLKAGVRILGGFAGTEESSDMRNWSVNKVYLDGNLGSDRVFHVVTAANDCDEETLLDGVTIRNGQASGSLSFRNGANIYVNGSSPKFKNLSVYSGTCGNNGANIYVENSNAEFDECNIDSGESDNYGGGIAVNNASPVFTGCNIADNYAYGMGGGVSITGDGVPFFLDCTFTENHANSSGNGGAFYVAAQVDTLLIVNSYFAENYASVSGGAMDISGKTIIVNSTFGTNYAQDASAKGGHLYLRPGADVEIYNSVLTAGSADIGEQIYAVSGSQLSVSNSMIEDCGGSGTGWDTGLGTDNGGNIDFDSYWSDFDAAVSSDWPGIDAGTSGIYETIEILNSVTFDINGYPRFRGTEVDMGHKEIPYCWLQMTILPSEISGEAQWTYNGGTDWHAHADGFWEVPQDITIEFSEVTGYTTPEPIDVSMDWSGDYMIFGEYVIISSVNQNSAPSVSAYPNPTSGIINIENQNGCSYDEIILLSTDGRIISRQEVNTANSFDLRNLPAGLYIIKAGNETIKINKN